MPTLTDLSERLSSIRDEKLSSLRKESASSGKALQRLAAVFEDATALERFRGRDRLTELIEWVRSPQDREEPLFDEGTICWLLDFWAWDEDRPPAVTVQTLAEELRLNATATIIGLEQQEDDAGRTGSSEEDPVTPREYGPFSVTVEHGAPPTTTDHQPPLTEVVEEILNLLVIEDPDRAPLLLHALCQLSNSERHLVEPVVASLLSSRSPLEHELDRYWNPTPKEQDAIDVTRDDEPEDHDDA